MGGAGLGESLKMVLQTVAYGVLVGCPGDAPGQP